MKTFREIRDDLNNIEVLPRAILSFSTRDKRTGRESGEKSVKRSFSISLWHLILGVVIVFSALQALSAAQGAVKAWRIRRRVKEKWEEKQEKLTEKQAN